MKIKFLYLILILFFLPELITAQKVRSLNECIGTGLEKNFSMLIIKNSEAIAKNNFSLGNAGFLPTIDISGRQNGTLNNKTVNFTDGTQTSSNGQYNSTANGGVTLGLTIFNGFNVQTTYKKLNELKQIGELNTQLAIENLVADIISGYYNYIQQIKLLNTLQYAVALSRERLRIDEERYLLGSSSKLQVLQSRVYLNSDSTNLSKQNEIVKASMIRLNELMAVEDLGEQFVLKDSSIEINQTLLYEKLLDETLSKNTSLQIAAKDKTVSEYDYKLTASHYYPYLNLSSGYNYNLDSYRNSGSSADNPMKSQITNGLNYGLTFGINVFDGFNQRRNIRNSSLSIKNNELKYRETEQSVKADLITLFSAYSNYLRLVTLENQNLQTATENLEIAMDRYKLGSLSGIDLREVQKSLLDARESLLSVEYQAKLAEISLLLISGGIMEYYQ
jgi:adhesin transport system outer membrane protein